MTKRIRTQFGDLAFYLAFSSYYYTSSPLETYFRSHLNLTNTSKHRIPAAVTRQNRLTHGARMGSASHLTFLKFSIIGGLRAKSEVGAAARERP